MIITSVECQVLRNVSGEEGVDRTLVVLPCPVFPQLISEILVCEKSPIHLFSLVGHDQDAELLMIYVIAVILKINLTKNGAQTCKL